MALNSKVAAAALGQQFLFAASGFGILDLDNLCDFDKLFNSSAHNPLL